jgi:hypothetical protein
MSTPKTPIGAGGGLAAGFVAASDVTSAACKLPAKSARASAAAGPAQDGDAGVNFGSFFMFDLPFRLAARLQEGERKKKSRCR